MCQTPALTPAFADTLFDNVKGVTATPFGQVVHFSALLVGDDGRVVRTFAEGEKLPERVKYRVDGKGRWMLPGKIASKWEVMKLGLSLLAMEGALRDTPAGQWPRATPRELDAAFARAQTDIFSIGVTTVADLGTSIPAWLAYRRTGDEGQLKVRIVGYADSVESMSYIGGGRPTPWLYNDHLRLSGLHISEQYISVFEKGKPPTKAQIVTRRKNLMSRAAQDNFQISYYGDVKEIEDEFTDLSLTYKGDRRWRNLFAEASSNASQNSDDWLLLNTSEEAKILFAEDRVGRLAANFHADFALYDKSPFGTERRFDASPVETYVDGQLVYKRTDAK